MNAKETCIFLPSCKSPMNLNVGGRQKKFISLVAKSRGVAMSEVVMGVLKGKFPKAASDKSYNEWVPAAAKAAGMTIYGWAQFNIAQSVAVWLRDIEGLKVEEAAELIDLYFKLVPSRLDRPTGWDNAMRYLRGEKEADLSWTIGTKNKLDEMREYYDKSECEFYNPIKK